LIIIITNKRRTRVRNKNDLARRLCFFLRTGCQDREYTFAEVFCFDFLYKKKCWGRNLRSPDSNKNLMGQASLLILYFEKFCRKESLGIFCEIDQALHVNFYYYEPIVIKISEDIS